MGFQAIVHTNYTIDAAGDVGIEPIAACFKGRCENHIAKLIPNIRFQRYNGIRTHVPRCCECPRPLDDVALVIVIGLPPNF
jgi:hypothetical protein